MAGNNRLKIKMIFPTAMFLNHFHLLLKLSFPLCFDKRIGIEQRVEINKVNAGGGKNIRIAQPLEIVAEKEAVHVQALADWSKSG